MIISVSPLLVPINHDENDVVRTTPGVWTGLLNGFGSDCLDWTTAADSGTGITGNPNAMNSSWHNGPIKSCDESHRLYCVEE